MCAETYTTEQDFVDCFLERLPLDDPWGSSDFNVEFNYSRGKTDIVTVTEDDKVVAIEAKLCKWRNALQQAYRNRCFADKSYVLLPIDAASRALHNEREFRSRGVGICSLSEGHINIFLTV